MKTIGLIGGMSWESTVQYYRFINERVRERVGGLHSARCVLYSFDFDEIEAFQRSEDWERAAEMLSGAARALERAGADLLLICANTMHIVADAVERAVRLPLLHIADATAERIRAQGLRRVVLLGTRITMQRDFYRGRLEQRHGLEVLVPPREEHERINAVIFDELCRGQVRDDSRAALVGIIRRMAEAGAEGVILGCTEIGLLVGPADSPVPLFDTARIHAEAAVDHALAD